MENHEQTTTSTTHTTTAHVTAKARPPTKRTLLILSSILLSPPTKITLLILSSILLSIGNCGGPLITRLYFIHGGNRVWLSSSLETTGWPVIIVVLIVLYLHRHTTTKNKPTTLIYMRPRLFFAVAFIGLLTGLDDYLYAYGVARLPISTSALILAPHLSFVAFFAYVLVKQKFTPYSGQRGGAVDGRGSGVGVAYER
ncbi:putative purine permease, plant [Helianthus anomalus]